MKKLYKAIAIFLCITFLCSCGKKPVDTPQSEAPVTKQMEQLADAKKENPDTVAWLTIANTEIDNPVMQTANNDDYLRKNEKGEEDIWGCYFADYYSVVADRNSLVQNTVIYGHSDKSEDPNGKRFTQLFKYLDAEFLNENPTITLTTSSEQLVFEVFAVFFTDIDFYYIDPQPSDQGFDKFYNTIQEKNEFLINRDITEGDKLLTLSACAYRYDKEKTGNQRLVVMAKLLDKDSNLPPFKATANPSPKRP